MNEADKLKLCVGCRQDYYNGKNEHGIKECWSLKSAKPVTRYRIHYWTTADTPGAFTKVRTLDCHHEPGKFAFCERLPSFARDVRDETK